MKKIAEFLDFSGGITDKDIPGVTNRYATADNLLIDNDRRLKSRDGWALFSSTAYQLGAAERVARLVNFDNDSELLAFQNKKAYAISAGAWAEVTGGASHSIFPTNSASSLLEEAQWNKHLFLATDSGDPVAKMYRDNSSVMQLRTAGLPAMTSTVSPADGGLADAISLANDIRTKMISHFGANGATAGTPNNSSTGHHVADGGGLLAAQASAVTASTAATTLASLITLLNTLRTQYNAHISDAQYEDSSSAPSSYSTTASVVARQYHMKGASGYTAYDPFLAYSNGTPNTGNQPLYKYRHYLNFSLADVGYTIPSSAVIADVLPYLNDLRDKWNWHTYASMTHYNAAYWQGNNYFTYLGSHATALARVETYTWAKITPNYGPFTKYVTDLLAEFDAHRLNGMHMEDDTVWAVPSGIDTTPDDLWETVTLLGWIAHGVTYHALESDTTFCLNGLIGDEQRQADSTSGGPNITLYVGGFAADKYKYMRVVPLVGVTGAYLWTLHAATTRGSLYNVTTSNTAASCVITTASNFATTYSAKQFMLTARHYHLGSYASQLFDPYDLASDWDSLDFRFSSAAQLQGLADIAARIASYLKSHTINRLTANPVTGASIVKFNGKTYNTYSNGLATASATGGNIIIHDYPGNASYTSLTPTGGTEIYLQTNTALAAANTFATQKAQNRFDTAPDAVSVNYRACFRYDYYVGATQYTDRGPTSDPINVIQFANYPTNEDASASFGSSTEKGDYSAEFTNFYQYANASNYNYAISDTTNFLKEIYRTIDSGQNYFRADVNGVAAAVSNATSTYSDYSLDGFLIDQLELYTNGGIADNDAPPLATGIHQANDRMYYVKGNRLYQSKVSDPDSVPGDFFEPFEENLIGVSSTRSNVVAFGLNKVYRVSGGFDDFGRGGMAQDTIYDRTGCISAQSIVKADNGIFFAGKDGFYFTDGYQCMRVTDLEDTFRSYTDSAAKRSRVQGAYDNISKRVYWTVQTGSSSYPDRIWVLDLQFGIKADGTPVTTFSALNSFNPTALAFYGGILHYGDNDGYIFKQTRGLNLDLVKDTGTAATSWSSAVVVYDFVSCHHDYGSLHKRKYFTRIGVQCEQQSTNLSMQIYSNSDKGRVTSTLPIIRSRKLTDWGDSKLDWISSVYTAKAGDTIDEWRWMKGDGSLRSNFRAFRFTNAYCVIVNSTDMGTITLANVSGNTWSATLTSLVATRKWPLYSVGYYLRINSVDYPITVRTSDSVVRFDATGLTAPTAGVPSSWELYGKPKNERLRLLSYVVTYDFGDEQETDFQGTTTTGANA